MPYSEVHTIYYPLNITPLQRYNLIRLREGIDRSNLPEKSKLKAARALTGVLESDKDAMNHTMVSDLNNAFLWSATEEGYDYWFCLHQETKDYLKHAPYAPEMAILKDWKELYPDLEPSDDHRPLI